MPLYSTGTTVVEFSKLSRRRAAAYGIGSTGLLGASVVAGQHMEDVADSYRSKSRNDKYAKNKGLRRTINEDQDKSRPSREAVDVMRPTSDRWQRSFAAQERIKNAKEPSRKTLSHLLKPGKVRDGHDKQILDRLVSDSKVRHMKRGMALPESKSSRGTKVKHDKLSSWATRTSGMPDQYAGNAAARAKIPGASWNEQQKKSTRGVVVTGKAKAANITNYSKVFSDQNRRDNSRQVREYISGPVTGSVARDAKPFDRKEWVKGKEAKRSRSPTDQRY